MLAERPSLATGAEGVADLLADDIGGIVEPENDPEALAERLRAYLGDEDRRRREGELARRRAIERFDQRVVAEQAERLLLQALEAR